MAADGGGSPERLTSSQLALAASSASSNDLVSVVELSIASSSLISVLSLEGDGRLKPLLRSAFALTHPAFSTDGRSLAYVSVESGQNEVQRAVAKLCKREGVVLSNRLAEADLHPSALRVIVQPGRTLPVGGAFSRAAHNGDNLARALVQSPSSAG
jgi:Tol biopolymer transport system component